MTNDIFHRLTAQEEHILADTCSGILKKKPASQDQLVDLCTQISKETREKLPELSTLIQYHVKHKSMMVDKPMLLRAHRVISCAKATKVYNR